MKIKDEQAYRRKIAREVEDKTGLCYDIDEMEWTDRRYKQ